MRKFKATIAFILLITISLSIFSFKKARAGSAAETLGVENDFGAITVDNTAGTGTDKLADYGIDKAKETGATRLGKLAGTLKGLNIILGIYDTYKDARDLAIKDSKHKSTLGWLADKGLGAVSVIMGTAAVVGTVAIVVVGAPATGAAAVVTGTGFLVTKIGVDVTRAVVNTDTAVNIEDVLTGRKKIVIGHLARPEYQEALDILAEEGIDDLYPGLRREIPDPGSTGIPVYKPNIYIYSNTPLDVNVKLYPYEYITESEPLYNKEAGWDAKIYSGSINGNEDFLFYEALVPDIGFQKSSGFIIKGDTMEGDIISMLDMYGFSKKEKSDFIEYWCAALDKNTSYVFYPQENYLVDNIMPLSIDPMPTNIFRIWFYIEPLDTASKFDAPIITPIIRDGYTLVEWGGLIKP